jgi:hypothetical protein
VVWSAPRKPCRPGMPTVALARVIGRAQPMRVLTTFNIRPSLADEEGVFLAAGSIFSSSLFSPVAARTAERAALVH